MEFRRLNRGKCNKYDERRHCKIWIFFNIVNSFINYLNCIFEFLTLFLRQPNWSPQLSAKCLNSNILRAGWNWLPLLFQVIMNSRLSNKAAHTTLQGFQRCHFQCSVELAWSQPRSHATLIVRCSSLWEAMVSNSLTWLCGGKQVTESAGQTSCQGGKWRKKRDRASGSQFCFAKQMLKSGFRLKLKLCVSIWTHN